MESIPQEMCQGHRGHGLVRRADRERSLAILPRRTASPSAPRSAFQCDRRFDSGWTSWQVVEAFPFNEQPRYLVSDRDSKYGAEVKQPMKNLGICWIRTPPRGPWRNGIAERRIDSIRRECFNHAIVLNERHFIRILAEYLEYSDSHRPCQGLRSVCLHGCRVEPAGRAVLGKTFPLLCY